MTAPFEINPTFCFTLLGSFVIYLWTRPSRYSVTGVLLVAWTLRAACIGAMGGLGAYYGVRWISWGAFLGVASLLILLVQIGWSPRSGSSRSELARSEPPQSQRKFLRQTFYAAAIFPLCSMLIGYALPLTIRLRPRTWDAFLFAFDGTLGFQPSFTLGRFLALHPLLWDLTTVIYYAMPLSAAFIYGAYRMRTRQPVAMLALFLTLMAAGYMLYVIFPAAGPGYAFRRSYPFHLPNLAGIAIAPMALPEGARNCMPSLHLAVALIVWWNSRIWPAWGRLLAFAFLLATIISTLGLGEHYLADLVVAFPFSLLVQAAWTDTRRARVSDSGQQARRYAIWLGGGLTVAWLVLLRYGLLVFQFSPAIPWTAIVLTLCLCDEAGRRLAAAAE